MKFVLIFSLALVAAAAACSFPEVGSCGDSKHCDFLSGALNCDCNYLPEVDNAVVTELQNETDYTYIQMAHALGLATNPSFPFGAVVVDSRDNGLRCQCGNGGNPNLLGFLNHAELAAMENCSRNGYVADSEWRYMTIYTNIESCNMCFGAASARKAGRIVFGASTRQLTLAKCFGQQWISDHELAVHAYNGGRPLINVRGPLEWISDQIVNDFPNRGSVTLPTGVHTC